MLKSILAAALLTTALASGAMAATPAAVAAPAAVKTPVVQVAATKMMHKKHHVKMHVIAMKKK
jgi:hypothetical protein